MTLYTRKVGVACYVAPSPLSIVMAHFWTKVFSLAGCQPPLKDRLTVSFGKRQTSRNFCANSRPLSSSKAVRKDSTTSARTLSLSFTSCSQSNHDGKVAVFPGLPTIQPLIAYSGARPSHHPACVPRPSHHPAFNCLQWGQAFPPSSLCSQAFPPSSL